MKPLPWLRPLRPVQSVTPPLAQLVSEVRQAGVEVVAWTLKGGDK